VTIDMDRIEHNTAAVVARCRAAGISVFGVFRELGYWPFIQDSTEPGRAVAGGSGQLHHVLLR